jgi:hypothetical protein
MAPVGYSGTPLAKKLGIKSGHQVAALNEPDGFREWLVGLPDGVRIRKSLGRSPDVIVAFTTKRSVLARRIDAGSQAIFPDGSLWVAWPKKSSKVPTDITEDVVRELALPIGLVDNKVCAISEVWSGLRLVWRKSKRRPAG